MLGDQALAAFSVRTTRTHFHGGETIITQGDEVGRIGVVVSGLLKIVVFTEDGAEHVLQTVGPGQLVGNTDGQRHGHAVEAATDGMVCWMPREAWNSFLKARPEHYQAFLSVTLQQYQEAQQGVIRMRGRNTLQRVAFWLLDQKPARGTGNVPLIRIALSRRDLASLLDMTAETLCRALHQLIERSAIRLPASDLVEIVDMERLRQLGKYPRDRIAGAENPRATPFPHPFVQVASSDRFEATMPPERLKRLSEFGAASR
ncbi:Crp/Fnr family transcriptional regulator [Sagittula salina]|uniref:Crp/Fnr family transcriptional regulator n=1 Tax=Sagittula salina TaxID=2820268 RepID=A0A940MLZ3_9RHOB|nr:Crp/Fnr family transcriptional regulator [Sagittula salina]MBP0482190.1 Crp/Fnr family transcriptional regulator [Sagittula salina]